MASWVNPLVAIWPAMYFCGFPGRRSLPRFSLIAISQKVARLTKQSSDAIVVRAFLESSGLPAHHQRKACVSSRTGKLCVLPEVVEGGIKIGSHPDAFTGPRPAFNRFDRNDLHNRPIFFGDDNGLSQHRLLHDL